MPLGIRLRSTRRSRTRVCPPNKPRWSREREKNDPGCSPNAQQPRPCQAPRSTLCELRDHRISVWLCFFWGGGTWTAEGAHSTFRLSVFLSSSFSALVAAWHVGSGVCGWFCGDWKAMERYRVFEKSCNRSTQRDYLTAPNRCSLARAFITSRRRSSVIARHAIADATPAASKEMSHARRMRPLVRILCSPASSPMPMPHMHVRRVSSIAGTAKHTSFFR